jgi:hypothetical protein
VRDPKRLFLHPDQRSPEELQRRPARSQSRRLSRLGRVLLPPNTCLDDDRFDLPRTRGAGYRLGDKGAAPPTLTPLTKLDAGLVKCSFEVSVISLVLRPLVR